MNYSNLAEAEFRYVTTGKIDIPQQGASGGELPLRIQALRARTIEGDARKAEAICLSSDQPLIDKIRTGLARGTLCEVRDAFTSALANAPGQDRAEFALEWCRLLNCEAEWDECIKAAHAAWFEEMSSVTRMTFLQVRSIALFESGHLPRALEDVEKIRSLSSLYPFAPVRVYADILSAKITGRLTSPAAGNKELGLLWTQLETAGKMSRDYLLYLLRAKLDLKRLQDQPTANYAEACVRVASEIGNDFYKALAMVDAYHSEKTPGPDLTRDVGEACLKFRRARIQFEALKSFQKPMKSSETWDWKGSHVTHFIFSEFRKVIQLSPFQVASFREDSVEWEALLALSTGSIGKNDLFSRLHGKRSYNAGVHDGYLHALLYRLRAKSGLKIGSSSGKLNLSNALWLPA